MELSRKTLEQETLLTADRRNLHQIPEEGCHEYKTSAYIRRALEELAPDSIETLAGTGLKAVFSGDKQRVVGIRADMDGLKISEETGCSFASTHEGYMHACGHDGHCAIALASARLVRDARNAGESLPTVVFIFQPAEESIGGADRMISEGVLENPDIEEIYGLHLMPHVPLGNFALNPGPMMASTCEMDIIIEGKSAHGAMPHLGVDCVAAAAHLYALLQTLISRVINPQEPALVTFGQITAGTRRNIIAQTARLEGIMRSLSPDVDKRLYAAILSAMEAVDAAFGTKSRIEEVSRFPVVLNDEALTQKVLPLLMNAASPAKPLMTAEDFAFYQQKRPGVFAFLGCGDGVHAAPLHSSQFQFNERALLYGLEYFKRILFDM